MTGDSTRSVHGAEGVDPESGSITTPIYQSATFGFRRPDEVAPAVSGESGKYVYSRWENPTVSRLEKKLAEFERAADAAFFSSGMAAISTSILTLVRPGDHLVAIRDLYGESYKLIHEVLPSFGVATTMVDTTDQPAMGRAIRGNTKVVYIESPTNPLLKVVDIARTARMAHKVGALLLIDNTFASPINQKPLALGADVSLHSATKYLNGHADILAGVAAGGREVIGRIKMMRRTLGGTLDPHAAWLILRGMKTMAIRVRAQNATGLAVARFLAGHRKVKRVNYPGLESHPQHAIAGRQMSGYGGMLSFELKGNKEDASRFVGKLRIPYIAASLGGVETLVSQPAELSHHQLSPKERAKSGFSEALIRLSVGIEDSEDLIGDLRRALA